MDDDNRRREEVIGLVYDREHPGEVIMQASETVDGKELISWPLTATDTKGAISVWQTRVFDPLTLRLLDEWAQLRSRCRRKALKKQAMGRIYSKLHAASTYQELLDLVADADAEEAYAMSIAVSSLEHVHAPNQIVLAGYRCDADHHARWPLIWAQKACAWAQDQAWLYDTDDFLSLRE